MTAYHIEMIGEIADIARARLATVENEAGDVLDVALPIGSVKFLRGLTELIIKECAKCEADMKHQPERVDPDAAVWIVGATEARCENCSGYGMTNMAYCPNCGKKMEGVRTFYRKDEEP